MLTKLGSPMAGKAFNSGAKVPTSGIYSVAHLQHRLPHEVTLIKGETFPTCSKCQAVVRFKLVYAAPRIDEPGAFRVTLYNLPVMEEEEEKKAAAS